MIRVLVVSDIRLYREAVAAFVARTLSLAGTATSRFECVELTRRLAPNVVLLDMAMPESLETVGDVVAEASRTPVVALTVPEVERDVVACAEAGVAGYVTREGSLDDLVAAIEGAARGEVVCSSKLAGVLLRRVATLAARLPPAPTSVFTPREREVAALMNEGLSNKQIAQELSIEVGTVKHHVHHILEKLDVRRRGEAIARLRAPRGSTP